MLDQTGKAPDQIPLFIIGAELMLRADRTAVFGTAFRASCTWPTSSPLFLFFYHLFFPPQAKIDHPGAD